MRHPFTLFAILFASILAVTATVRAAAAPVVLFDQAHKQRFLAGETGPLQLSKLAERFRQQGFQVAVRNDPLTQEALNGVTALVISGPFAALSPEEVDAVTGYLKSGGHLAVMLHISPPLSQLLDRLGVVVSNSVIHEHDNIIDGDPLSFRVTRLESHPLTKGIDHFSLYGVWALLDDGPNTSVVARTGDKAWIDLNGDRMLSRGDAVRSFAVAISGTLDKGRFAVFGDDAIFQNQYMDQSNTALADNLAQWLK